MHLWMPRLVDSKLPIELFRLFRDRIGSEARRRRSFTAAGLRTSLAEEGYISPSHRI